MEHSPTKTVSTFCDPHTTCRLLYFWRVGGIPHGVLPLPPGYLRQSTSPIAGRTSACIKDKPPYVYFCPRSEFSHQGLAAMTGIEQENARGVARTPEVAILDGEGRCVRSFGQYPESTRSEKPELKLEKNVVLSIIQSHK